MANVGIVTDTNSCFTVDEAERAGIHVLSMPFYIDGELKYEGVDFSQSDFYEALRNGSDVSTSMPIVGNVLDLWTELLKKYQELVYIPMSSGLSSSCEAAKMLAEDFDGRVEVVDNHRIGPTMKLSAHEARALACQGKSAKEIREYLEETAKDSSIYIMVDTLKYLRKGGRLTPAVAAIGTLLRIKPVLQIQGEKLDTYAKARTLSQGKQIMIDALKNDLEKRFNAPDGKDMVISIAHTENEKEARAFRDEILALYPNREILIDPLSLSISCHIGPGALAFTVSKSFIKEMR